MYCIPLNNQRAPTAAHHMHCSKACGLVWAGPRCCPRHSKEGAAVLAATFGEGGKLSLGEGGWWHMWCQPVLAWGSQLPPGWLCFAPEAGLHPKQQQSWSPWRSSCIQQANKAEHAGGGVASPRLLASSTLLARSGGKNSGILSLDVVSATYCGAEIAVGILAEILRNINYPNSLGLQLSWQSYEHICLVSSQLQ